MSEKLLTVRILTCAFATALALVSQTNLRADESTVLLNETFDGTNSSTTRLPQSWEPGGRKNCFFVSGGVLHGVAESDDVHGPSLGVPIRGHHLTLTFDLKVERPKGRFLLLIDGESQFSGQAHLLRLGISTDDVSIAQDRGDPESKLQQKLAKDNNGGKRIPPTPEQLADPSFYRVEPLVRHKASVFDGKWHHIRLQLQRNHVSVVMDDNAAITATGTVLDVPKTCLVFLVNQSGHVQIDNVKLTKLNDDGPQN
tara:strand:- start:1128578 stop:1129342 length:765 start_codon:yes stop_codon:yes gene_type:complete